jgi:hypothetical protein
VSVAALNVKPIESEGLDDDPGCGDSREKLKPGTLEGFG